MGCGCKKPQADQTVPTPQQMVSEETTVKDEEIEIRQKFDDGSERLVVMKRRNVGVERKLNES
jgi:hypothetical protein